MNYSGFDVELLARRFREIQSLASRTHAQLSYFAAPTRDRRETLPGSNGTMKSLQRYESRLVRNQRHPFRRITGRAVMRRRPSSCRLVSTASTGASSRSLVELHDKL